MLVGAILCGVVGLILAFAAWSWREESQQLIAGAIACFLIFLSAYFAFELGRGDPVHLGRLDESVIYRFWGSSQLKGNTVIITVSDPDGDVSTVMCQKEDLDAEPGELVQLKGGRLEALPTDAAGVREEEPASKK